MRSMSFSLTTPQIIAQTKTVTRRMGWEFLKPGDLLKAVEKCMGLKKGEKQVVLAVVRVVSVSREFLSQLETRQYYAGNELAAEGFPHLTASEFIEMFCKTHKGCDWSTPITRIEFEYVMPAPIARPKRDP